MTSPTSYLVDQITALHQRISNLESQRVTYVQAAVSSINVGASTFAANIAQADGSLLNIAGISSPPNFLPSTGNTVTLALSGAQLVYQPYGIAAGAVTPTLLSPNAPNAPTSLSLSTAPSIATDGTTTSTITASWTAPTLTAGGTGILGTLTYVVQSRVTGTTDWSTRPATATTRTVITGLIPGAGYDVQVAAMDQVSNTGAFTAISTITAAPDGTAPAVPTTPTVGNYLGELKITWDGKLSGGVNPPADFARAEVHISATTGFTPSSATLVGNLSIAGSIFATATYGTTMFAKLIAVDLSGNKSAASAQASGATAQVAGTDVSNGAIAPVHLSPNAPNAPTSLTLATASSQATDGTVHATVTATWTAPTLTVGGSGIVGVLTYLVRSRTTGSTNWTTRPAAASPLVVTGVIPGLGYDVQVAAVDQVGNIGAFTATSTVTAAGDTTAPGAPTTPTVGSYLGQLKITWDGNLAGPVAPPADFDYLEVHTSTTTGFTPSSTTLHGNMATGGSVFVNTPYGTTTFTKLVAVDRTGNKSAASTQASGSSVQVAGADIASGAVDTTQLSSTVNSNISTATTNANTALTTANGKNTVTWSASAASGSGIATGDIWFQQTSGVVVGAWQWSGTAWVARTFGDAVLNSLTAGKITTGTLSAAVTLSGSIKTGTTGQRVEIDANGVRLFNSGGGTVVDLNSSTGTGTFSGNVDSALIRSSTSGQRLEITGGSNNLNFHPTGAGAVATINSTTDANGNAGVTATAGGTAHGFNNMTSILSDIGFVHSGGGSSFLHFENTKANIGVASGIPLSVTTDQDITLFEGTGTWGKLSPATTHGGMSRIMGFAADGGDLANFTFGTGAQYTNDADVYAGRFISTQASGTGGFIYFSDQRMKKNIQTANLTALPLILGTPVRQFQWANTGASDVGWIAQEVPDVALMSTTPGSPVNGLASSATPVGISLDKMVLLLWKAMQELLPLLPGGGGRPLPMPSYSRADVATITDSVTAVLTPGG